MGARVETRLERRGFYPAGGGRFTVRDRAARGRCARSISSSAARSAGAGARPPREPRTRGSREREEATAAALLPAEPLAVERRDARPTGAGPGNAILLEVESEHATEVFTAFGESGDPRRGRRRRGRRRDARVARGRRPRRAAPRRPAPAPARARRAAAPSARCAPTPHTRTNADVIARFLPDRSAPPSKTSVPRRSLRSRTTRPPSR